ncbi:unnamed protein product [marine sediment metagenome]|uniref:Uncharacterized protein n=1 Tax=marine sediment metagenome TaxID=412755 RepID=X1R897_9ZZZZ
MPGQRFRDYLKEFREANCRGCFYADEAKVGTDKPCCTCPGIPYIENNKCGTRKEAEETMRECFICGKLYEGGREMTCSDVCHGELARRHIAEFGEFKKVVNQTTGIAYRVPTRDIIEKGIKWRDLDQYPLWEEG